MPEPTDISGSGMSGDGMLRPCAEYTTVSDSALELECDSEQSWIKVSPRGASSSCSSEDYVGSVCSDRLASWQDCAIGNNVPTLIKESGNQSKFEENVAVLEKLLGLGG